ncbi:hypothetical protein MHYP_G00254240 [Metynnis hypsauchen]
MLYLHGINKSASLPAGLSLCSRYGIILNTTTDGALSSTGSGMAGEPVLGRPPQLIAPPTVSTFTEVMWPMPQLTGPWDSKVADEETKVNPLVPQGKLSLHSSLPLANHFTTFLMSSGLKAAQVHAPEQVMLAI